jgi:YesN/AraC family two-component response regulator
VATKLRLNLRRAVSGAVKDSFLLSGVYFALCRCVKEVDGHTNELLRVGEEEGALENSYYYPIEEEQKLLGCILFGNEKDALCQLEYLFHKNSKEFQVTLPSSINFVYAMKGTLIRAKSEIKLDSEGTNHFNRIVYLQRNFDMGRQLTQLADGISILCREVQTKKEKKNNRLIDEINRFIEEHYQDVQLGLGMISHEFMLAENYLSYFYKVQTGENISSRVEGVRLQKARELLQDSRNSVKSVAPLVGYNNMNTFYKAFRRVHGMSPKAYCEKVSKAQS